MRWESQQVEVSDGGALPGLQRIAGLVRSVRTPEFEGITFHEVMCKSALNKVPEASFVPFRWTINPYRGCSHACRYCLAGSTKILMGDGKEVPLSQVQVGDTVLGTRPDGAYRRLVRTEVLAHWRTSKPAYWVELDDGTALVASGDHRFLTADGWKHVTARDGDGAGGDESDDGGARLDERDGGNDGARATTRPHLTPRDQLVGLRTAVVGAAVRNDSRLTVSYVRSMDVVLPMYDITTGTGDFIANGVVSHNCFARNTHTYLDLDAGDDFDRQVVVKVNLAEVVRREVVKKSWRREHVAMGTNTDPYQRAEGRYQLMPGVIEALAGSGTPFSILTKGTLLRRDLPLLAEAGRSVEVGIGVSLGLLDDAVHRAVEPGTPSPRARLELIRAVRAAGLPCNVLLAPILPALTDSAEHLDALVSAVAEAGATGVHYIPLHLRRGAREWYLQWLRTERPDLLPTYRRLYQGAYAGQRYRDWLRDRVEPLLRRHGLRTPNDDEPESAPAEDAHGEPDASVRDNPWQRRWTRRLPDADEAAASATAPPDQGQLF